MHGHPLHGDGVWQVGRSRNRHGTFFRRCHVPGAPFPIFSWPCTKPRSGTKSENDTHPLQLVKEASLRRKRGDDDRFGRGLRCASSRGIPKRPPPPPNVARDSRPTCTVGVLTGNRARPERDPRTLVPGSSISWKGSRRSRAERAVRGESPLPRRTLPPSRPLGAGPLSAITSPLLQSRHW